MARLYTNENFPLQCSLHLRALNHDVLTIQESGQAGIAQPDEMVLEFAHKNNRILVTMNRKHFIRLHERFVEHSGIIVCHFNPNFLTLANQIHAILEESGNLDSRLIRINRY